MTSLVSVLFDLSVSKAQNLINILQFVWITTQREIGKRNQKRGDILDGQVGSSLKYEFVGMIRHKNARVP